MTAYLKLKHIVLKKGQSLMKRYAYILCFAQSIKESIINDIWWLLYKYYM